MISIAQPKRQGHYAHAYDPANLKFDCSGFVPYGSEKPVSTSDKRRRLSGQARVPVSKANLRRAIWSFNSKKAPNDVTLGFMGNGYVIHNTAREADVTNMNTSSYMKNDYKTARRVIGVPLINVPATGRPT